MNSRSRNEGSVGFLIRSGLKLLDFLQGGVFLRSQISSRKRFKVLPVLFRVFFNRFNGRNGYAICLTPFHRVFIRKFRTPQIKQGDCDGHAIWWDRAARPPIWPIQCWSQVLISRSVSLVSIRIPVSILPLSNPI